ncbi:MBOAT family O-acyltransferase [Lutimonas halocynthiae]|uniref:MBOAT family O-acyltransferase n=1 Tax=Lutimonas halocynthiae TaxID=1446477 RepID=UPI0025B32673|nr:MBOAT family O-acyltransferase [Lutimonas halocynthiae]MDN3643381.1 MBOAT family O-acyltransferase [Lutimonas halocynthiae]
MIFNSIDFAIFLPIVFILYWIISSKNLKLQNTLIVASSYFFYGWWDWRFLTLILFSTIVDFIVGKQIYKEKDEFKKKIFLWISISVNLGFLGFFKYYNFFLSSFGELFTFFGIPMNAERLNIILPVGISFYTFQTLSYTIDIYKEKLKPTNDFVAFSAFVSFFPQLVAGPIERAVDLLPQFSKQRTFSYEDMSKGLKMMLWGFFMKIVVADRLSLYVDEVYGNIDIHSSLSLVVATLFFSIQIYCDFAGYSLIAIGLAKLFGFDLMENFHRPYLATTFKDFWSRWHISLSTWFRDYLYIPLGGNRNGVARTNYNLLITFIISGLWHGANLTFIIWGFLHGLFLVIEKTFNKISFPNMLKIVLVFVFTNFAWIFFRADSLKDAFDVIQSIFSQSDHSFYLGDKGIFGFSIMAIIILLINDFVAEYYNKVKLFNNKNIVIRYTSIVFIVLYIIAFGVFDNSQFIYFQF